NSSTGILFEGLKVVSLVPEIFANQYSNPTGRLSQLQRNRFRLQTGTKIPLVIEVAIGRQKALMHDLQQPAVLDHRSSVVTKHSPVRSLLVFVEIDEPDNRGNALTGRQSLFHQNAAILPQEVQIDEQFFIQAIAGQAHFRQKNDVSLLRPSFLDRAEDKISVSE